MLYNTFPYMSEPPIIGAITEETARKWLRLETGVTDADSDIIQMCINGAVATFERFAMLQIMKASYTWYLDCFPTDIPYYVNISDIKIEYKEDKVAPDWILLDGTKWQYYQQGFRQNAIEYTPDVKLLIPQIVRVNFKTGYETQSEIPANWLMPIRAILAEVWDNRGDGLGDRMRLSEKLMNGISALVIR